MKKLKLVFLVAIILALSLAMSSCGIVNRLKDLENLAESLADLLPNLTFPFGEAGTAASDSDKVELDDQGRVVKLSHFDGDGKLIFTHVTTWDDERIANKTSYNGKGEQTGSVDYEYDDRGNCTVMSWYFWNTGALMKTERKYDKYDRLIEDIGHGSGSVSTNRSVFEYDESDAEHLKRYSKRTYWPSWPGDRYSVSTYEYNEQGKLVKITTVDQNGDLQNYDVYTYDENGRAEGFADYGADGKVRYSYKYVYDENGVKIGEERYNEKGELEGKDY